jgi:hypothetical protein
MKIVKKDVPFEAYDVLDCHDAECGLITNFEGEGYVASVRDPKDHDKRHMVNVAGLSMGAEEFAYLDGDIYHAVANALDALEIARFPEADDADDWPYRNEDWRELERVEAWYMECDLQLERESRGEV